MIILEMNEKSWQNQGGVITKLLIAESPRVPKLPLNDIACLPNDKLCK